MATKKTKMNAKHAKRGDNAVAKAGAQAAKSIEDARKKGRISGSMRIKPNEDMDIVLEVSREKGYAVSGSFNPRSSARSNRTGRRSR